MKQGNRRLLATLKRELRVAIAMGNPKATANIRKLLTKVRAILNIKPNRPGS